LFTPNLDGVISLNGHGGHSFLPHNELPNCPLFCSLVSV
jgi:hypothetical protein